MGNSYSRKKSWVDTLKKVRFLSFLKTHRLLIIVLVFCLFQTVRGQDEEIIVISRKVGTTIDAEENEILGLFPDVKGFESAQFYQVDTDRYYARIVYLDRTRPRTLKRFYSWRQLQRMKYIAGSHPEITDEMRAMHRDRLSYLRVYEELEEIPPLTFCTIRHVSGRKISGTFVNYRDRSILFQSPTRRILFPIDQIKSISYRLPVDDDNPVKKSISFVAGAVVGLGVAEFWNTQSSPSVDETWQNRFTGAAVGLITGNEMFEVATLLTSPKKFIAISDEEVAKFK